MPVPAVSQPPGNDTIAEFSASAEEVSQGGEAAAIPAPPVGEDHNEAARRAPGNYILFPSESSRLNTLAMSRLREHAARLNAARSSVVTLVVYTAPGGSRSYNLAVAEHRLRAVVNALRSLGARREQIRKINAGSRVLPELCQTEICRLELRSVELVYEK